MFWFPNTSEFRLNQSLDLGCFLSSFLYFFFFTADRLILNHYWMCFYTQLCFFCFLGDFSSLSPNEKQVVDVSRQNRSRLLGRLSDEARTALFLFRYVYVRMTRRPRPVSFTCKHLGSFVADLFEFISLLGPFGWTSRRLADYTTEQGDLKCITVYIKEYI